MKQPKNTHKIAIGDKVVHGDYARTKNNDSWGRVDIMCGGPVTAEEYGLFRRRNKKKKVPNLPSLDTLMPHYQQANIDYQLGVQCAYNACRLWWQTQQRGRA